MKVIKSSRHSKITGDFAEGLVLYWLSKYGFECARVDHTGIDLIARNNKTNEVMGVSVKSRSRSTGTEGTFVSIQRDNFPKVKAACKAFGCVPYFAIVVDEGTHIKMFILSMAHLLELFPVRQTTCAWKMSEKYIEQYEKDPKIQVVTFEHKTSRWWGKESSG